MKHEEAYAPLDLIRGLAAMVVCLGHLWNPLFTDLRPVERGASLPWLLVHFIGGKNRDAVMVFFVLSGFFVGGSVLRARDRFRWKGYLVARLTRLWVVVAPALLFAWAVGLAVRAFWSTPLPDGTGWGDYVAQLAFVQGWLTPVYPLDPPIWSLTYEFWYYLLFPLAMLGALGWGRTWAWRVAAGAMGLAVFAALPLPFQQYFPLWLLGAGLYAAVMRSERAFRPWLLTLAWLLLTAALLSESPMRAHLGRLTSDYVVAVAFAAAVFGLVRWAPVLHSPRLWRWSRFAADISFSLYMTHAPFIYLLESGPFRTRHLVLDATGAAVYAGSFALMIAVAVGFWWLFERHYLALRGWVMGQLGA